MSICLGYSLDLGKTHYVPAFRCICYVIFIFIKFPQTIKVNLPMALDLGKLSPIGNGSVFNIKDLKLLMRKYPLA